MLVALGRPAPSLTGGQDDIQVILNAGFEKRGGSSRCCKPFYLPAFAIIEAVFGHESVSELGR